MGAFAYSAINANGAELNGEISAPDLATAREQLRMRGLLARTITEVEGAAAAAAAGAATVTPTRGKKVKAKSLQVFSRQFATMIEAGLNVVSALVILEN